MEFSNKNIVIMYPECISNDSLIVQFYVSLPEGASKPEGAATTHVLPLATLRQVFVENGDIIEGYTSSFLLPVANISSDGSPWKHLLFGVAVVIFGFILTFLLCIGVAVYRWKQKKRQVTYIHR